MSGNYPTFAERKDGAGGSPGHRFLKRALKFLKKRWWVVALGLLLAGGVRAALDFFRAQTFSSYGSLWVSGKVQIPEEGVFREDLNHFYGNQIALLGSPRLIAQAHARVQESKPDLKEIPVKVRINQRRSTSIFQLQASGTDAAYLQPFLNALMDEYLKTRQKLRTGTSEETLSLVNLQLGQFERELKAEEEKLNTFSATNNVLVLQAQSSIDGDYLAKLKTQLADLRLAEQSLEASLTNRALHTPTNDALALGQPSLPLPDGTSLATSPLAPELASTRMRLQLLEAERRELTNTHRPQHPKVIRLDEDIVKQTKLVDTILGRGREEAEARRVGLTSRTQSIEATIKEYEARIEANNQRLAELTRLRGNVEKARASYNKMQGLFQNLDVSKNLDKETVQILDRATPPSADEVDLLKGYILAAILGLALSLGLIALEARLNDKITSAEDLTDVVTERIVAHIPKTSAMKGKNLLAAPRSNGDGFVVAESFRNIRSYLFYTAPDGKRPRVILVTSSVPGEGKSVVSANLAQTLSALGSRVVVIDADLRCGRLHKILGLPMTAGLSELLRAEISLEEAAVPTQFKNVFLIPTGLKIEDATDHFLGDAVDRLLEQLLTRFDYVVLDSPPVLVTDDATSLAPKTDGVLFVVKNAYTRTALLQNALELLYQRQVKIIGMVMNCAELSRKRYSYYYKYANGSQRQLKAPAKA